MASQLDTTVEARVKRLGRYCALLSAIDREIIHPRSRDDLFARICRIAVDVGTFRMAWIGQVGADRLSIVPVVNAGGAEFLERVKKLYPETIRIVLSGYTDLETVTDAINRGAIYRFLTKPWEDEMLRNQIHEAFRVARGLARL